MSAITGPVLPFGIVGFEPGFSGGMNWMRLSVLYTSRSTVRKRSPRAPLPKCDCMDAEFALS